jgi:hypothetical protein
MYPLNCHRHVCRTRFHSLFHKVGFPFIQTQFFLHNFAFGRESFSGWLSINILSGCSLVLAAIKALPVMPPVLSLFMSVTDAYPQLLLIFLRDMEEHRRSGIHKIRLPRF